MRDDLIIGKFKGSRPCSAYHEQFFPPNISHNSQAYWITGCILDTGMTVYKDTPQGQKIKEFLKTQEFKKLQDYLDQLILEQLSVKKIKKRIEDFGEKRFKEGMRSKQIEIQRVLGLL